MKYRDYTRHTGLNRVPTPPTTPHIKVLPIVVAIVAIIIAVALLTACSDTDIERCDDTCYPAHAVRCEWGTDGYLYAACPFMGGQMLTRVNGHR